MSNNNHDEATFSLENCSLHVNISFLAKRIERKVFNFNVIHALVFKCAHDYKIWCRQNLWRFLAEQNKFCEPIL